MACEKFSGEKRQRGCFKAGDKEQVSDYRLHASSRYKNAGTDQKMWVPTWMRLKPPRRTFFESWAP